MNLAGNRLYVFDRNARVQVFDENDTYVESWGSEGKGRGEFNNTGGICISPEYPEGMVYVSDSHRVQAFGPDGSYCDNIVKFGNVVRCWGSAGKAVGQFEGTYGLCMNSAGSKLYIADFNNHRVQVLALPPETWSSMKQVEEEERTRKEEYDRIDRQFDDDFLATCELTYDEFLEINKRDFVKYADGSEFLSKESEGFAKANTAFLELLGAPLTDLDEVSHMNYMQMTHGRQGDGITETEFRWFTFQVLRCTVAKK